MARKYMAFNETYPEAAILARFAELGYTSVARVATDQTNRTRSHREFGAVNDLPPISSSASQRHAVTHFQLSQINQRERHP